MTVLGDTQEASSAWLDRYHKALLPVFGRPQRVFTRGQGCHLWDADGREYLDLLAGLAVNALGHAHPRLVDAVSRQAAELIHVSNFYTTPQQVGLAERLLGVAEAPPGSAVFFGNSGTEAMEAVVKLARRTGRLRILAAEGGFHGRSTGALALTHKPQFREPFEPLLPGVEHIPYNDEVALKSALEDGEPVAALVLEPILGESGVVPADPGYLRAARELTTAHGVLLILDEIQTGIGRTGSWFAFQQAGIVPDAVTVAKGLGGGVPIGALMTMGPQVSGLLTAGQHGSTFGGNPLACAAGLAVLEVIESEGLLDHVRDLGSHLSQRICGLGHPLVDGVRGAGLLLGVALTRPVAARLASLALDAGFIVNAPNPQTMRLAPPLILSRAEADVFVDALPALLDEAASAEVTT